ncbi:hypothetical protein [Natronobacterium texcoconense]|uniref:Uncharacterized protein n=1 Tax=Natronobacterium texcoconense TaxID=1095778 RepID=A0A1H1GNB9_NATTX|nr:hypothetical protein [Natronobacterium texcoconense]SDR14376.1 hypothetical protein SAMN04489842_2503 [Natronobacterium texcoconense]
MIDSLERVRRPEYTGENRCWPCTVTNGLLLTVPVAVVAVLGQWLLAAAIGVVGTAGILLRGYVVPYTPRFAPRLAAALPVEAFDHDGGSDPGSLSGSVDETGPSGETVLAELVESGVVLPEGEQLRLESEFRDDWREEMTSLRDVDLETLAGVADDLTPSSIEAKTSRVWDRSQLVLESDAGPPVTLRRGVAVAELAAVCALESRVDDAAVRRAAGRPLRSLLAECPLCDGELTVSQASCCGEATPVGKTPSEKLLCPACNERFFVFDESAA